MDRFYATTRHIKKNMVWVLGFIATLVILCNMSVLLDCYNFYQNSDANYHPGTFGIDLYKDPCKPLSTQQFRKNINNPQHFLDTYVKCNSNMCINQKFKGHTQIHAYDVEHIIDLNGKEFLNCNKNIVGNYVMAKNEWNQIMGVVAKFDYERAMENKKKVYGIYMMRRIRANLKKCCSTQ